MTFTSYCIPLTSPVTVTLVAVPLVPNCVKLVPSVDVKTSYPVSVPQVLGSARRHAGSTHDTASVVFPGATLRFSTAPVDVAGVTEGEASDAMLVPAEFVAVTVTVYG